MAAALLVISAVVVLAALHRVAAGEFDDDAAALGAGLGGLGLFALVPLEGLEGVALLAVGLFVFGLPLLEVGEGRSVAAILGGDGAEVGPAPGFLPFEPGALGGRRVAALDLVVVGPEAAGAEVVLFVVAALSAALDAAAPPGVRRGDHCEGAVLAGAPDGPGEAGVVVGFPGLAGDPAGFAVGRLFVRDELEVADEVRRRRVRREVAVQDDLDFLEVELGFLEGRRRPWVACGVLRRAADAAGALVRCHVERAGAPGDRGLLLGEARDDVPGGAGVAVGMLLAAGEFHEELARRHWVADAVGREDALPLGHDVVVFFEGVLFEEVVLNGPKDAVLRRVRLAVFLHLVEGVPLVDELADQGVRVLAFFLFQTRRWRLRLRLGRCRLRLRRVWSPHLAADVAAGAVAPVLVHGNVGDDDFASDLLLLDRARHDRRVGPGQLDVLEVDRPDGEHLVLRREALESLERLLLVGLAQVCIPDDGRRLELLRRRRHLCFRE
mmetsp:Transcript_3012/g.10031  ORF Transcript_3012/g.10031 Transcript_3012/m.10031 type:complete len:496 (+) Transcript_3012:541-2028(+)